MGFPNTILVLRVSRETPVGITQEALFPEEAIIPEEASIPKGALLSARALILEEALILEKALIPEKTLILEEALIPEKALISEEMDVLKYRYCSSKLGDGCTKVQIAGRCVIREQTETQVQKELVYGKYRSRDTVVHRRISITDRIAPKHS